jgi:hypothetical protein
MEKTEFIEHLADNPDLYEWLEGDYNDHPGIYVKNVQYDTKTHFTYKVIENNDLNFLLAKTHHGKNVDHITRVTGFFSKTSSWNNGKKGELKERHRVVISEKK